jgi:hypothetical protein
MKLCPRSGAPGICVDHELLAHENLGVWTGLDHDLLYQVLLGSSSTIRSSPRCSWDLRQPALSELLLCPRCFLRFSSHSVPGASPLSGKHLVLIYVPAHLIFGRQFLNITSPSEDHQEQWLKQCLTLINFSRQLKKRMIRIKMHRLLIQAIQKDAWIYSRQYWQQYLTVDIKMHDIYSHSWQQYVTW